MVKCSECVWVIEEMEHKSPVGYVPFGWGPSGENPNHFYVFLDDREDPEEGVSQELDVITMCEVLSPVKRI